MIYTPADYSTMQRAARELGESDAENMWSYENPYVEPDLSGEYADGMTPREVAKYVGLYHIAGAMMDLTDEQAADYADTLNELCDEYEDAFRTRINLLNGD